MYRYNEAISSLCEKTKVGKVSPLTFQLKTVWDEATEVTRPQVTTSVFPDNLSAYFSFCHSRVTKTIDAFLLRERHRDFRHYLTM